MRAFIVDRYGRGGTLRAGNVPESEVGEHDVLVQVHAAGVNALDAKIRDGEFKLILPYRPPFVLGNDVAGVVVRVGARVRKFVPVTRSTRGRTRTGSAPSRSSSPSTRTTWRRSRRGSRWRRRPRSRWSD